MDASSEITGAVLGWYDAHARVLPWRAPPGTPAMDPYRVWLSEVMLQQTTVAAVQRYFTEFTRRWPDVSALAAADEAEIMAAWAGLGYYARARNLVACARAVAAMGGKFPDTEAALRQLPGLGDYTAAAIAAIAFGRRAVVVDANVERVAARLFAVEEPLPSAKKAIRALTDRLTPESRAGDFAQAMMDLGATICSPRAPRCLLCPLSSHCAAASAEQAERYPLKAAKKPRPERQGTAFWIERDGAVWLVRRKGHGMLGGMRALPDDGWSARHDGTTAAPLSGPWREAGWITHVFSHFSLRLRVMAYTGADWAGIVLPDGEWWPLDNFEQAGLPSLFAKAGQLALAMNDNQGSGLTG